MHIARSVVLPFIAVIIAAAVMSLFTAVSTNADELDDLKRKLDIVEPGKAEALLAEGRAREDRIRSHLPQLRKAERKFENARQAYMKLQHSYAQTHQKYVEADRRYKKRLRRDEMLEKSVFGRHKLTQEQQNEEFKRLRRVHEQGRRPLKERRDALRKKDFEIVDELVQSEIRLSEVETTYIYLRRGAGLSGGYPKHGLLTERFIRTKKASESGKKVDIGEYPSPKPVSEELDDIVKRNNRLATVAKIGRMLGGEERAAKEPLSKAGDKPQPAPPPVQPKKGPDKTEAEAPQSGVGKAGSGQRSEEKAAEEPAPKADEPAKDASKATDRDAEASEHIADARRYYHEGRAFDAELQLTKAADSYRVAMSLLAQARARTESPARAAKIDTAIDNVSKRLADLPKQPQKQKDTPAEAGQRQIGNRECASKFPNSIMVKPDSKGGFFCRCPSGYAWNDGRTACVKVRNARARGQAACRKSFSHSVFVGFRNGLPRCRCPRGRVWNQSRTACVRAPKRRNVRRPDPRAAQAMYALGALIGQAIRSGSGSQRQPHCHREPNGTIHCQ